MGSVDIDAREVVLRDGTRERFDYLLSTNPMDLLVKSLEGDVPGEIPHQASRLRHSGSHLVGIGLDQRAPSEKCWMFFSAGQRAVLPGDVSLQLLA